MQAESGNTVDIKYESKQKFSAGLENNFLVLPDGKTIVGRDASDSKRLMIEDIQTNQVSCVGMHQNEIRTLLYNEKTRSLLVGDSTGHVIQYQKKKDFNTFTKVKDYGDLGIGSVHSSCLFGELGILGGYDKSSIAVIRIPEQELVAGKIITAFKNVDSLQVCEVSESKVLLSVGGRDPLYSGNTTDVFEIMVETKKKKQRETDMENEQVKKPSTAQKEKVETQSAGTNALHRMHPSLLPRFHLQNNSFPYQIIETLISSIPRYVENLFRHFAKVLTTQLHSHKSNSNTNSPLIPEAQDQPPASPSPELTQKIQSIIYNFELHHPRKTIHLIYTHPFTL